VTGTEAGDVYERGRLSLLVLLEYENAALVALYTVILRPLKCEVRMGLLQQQLLQLKCVTCLSVSSSLRGVSSTSVTRGVTLRRARGATSVTGERWGATPGAAVAAVGPGGALTLGSPPRIIVAPGAMRAISVTGAVSVVEEGRGATAEAAVVAAVGGQGGCGRVIPSIVVVEDTGAVRSVSVVEEGRGATAEAAVVAAVGGQGGALTIVVSSTLTGRARGATALTLGRGVTALALGRRRGERLTETGAVVS